MDHLDSSDEIYDEHDGVAMSSALARKAGEPDPYLEKMKALYVDETGPLSSEYKSSEKGKWHSQDLREYSNSNIWIPETFHISAFWSIFWHFHKIT